MAAILHFRPCRRRILHNSISSIHFYSSNSDDNKKVSSLQEIRKNLSQFRQRSHAPPPPPSSSSPPVISFQELYKRNVMAKSDQVSGSSGPGVSGSKTVSLDSIRMSLKNMKPNAASSQLQSRLSGQRNDIGMNLRPKIGNDMPESFNKKDLMSTDEAAKTEYVRMYSYGELGKKLQSLRPPNKKSKFSISELSERLNALREAEEKEIKSTNGNFFRHIRESLIKLGEEDKSKNTPAQRVNSTSLFLGGAQSFMSSPPKEALVEKYFHPDHMSSAEKQKLELKNVREKFKISDSDCGSSRVQVAQLTTKIKHLATVLHKKDKHSQKGLQAMVQRRKKLLKYLRRTDWDSYCFCIAELGLRDVAYDKASILERRWNEIKKLDEESKSKKKKKSKKAA